MVTRLRGYCHARVLVRTALQGLTHGLPAWSRNLCDAGNLQAAQVFAGHSYDSDIRYPSGREPRLTSRSTPGRGVVGDAVSGVPE